MLAVSGLLTRYGNIEALRNVDVEVQAGEIVTLIGANGAGKSTLLMTICGNPRAASGRIAFEGQDITRYDTHMIVRLGISQVPEGRRVFPRMTVFENLQLGATLADPAHFEADLERVFTLFPILRERRDQRAGTLSGGEQQMLAIGRALMSRPRLLLLDEPSLGLAPLVVKDIFAIIERINREQGVAMLLVEQNARVALGVADYGYIMENGRIVINGPKETLLGDPDVQRFYLGSGEHGEERVSFRDVKHYKRRKRWLS